MLEELLKRRKPGHALEQAFYTDPGVYELELERIFYRNWILAGHVSELPETGDRVFISFAHSRVHVAVPLQRDMFEPRIFGTLLDFAVVREYYLDLTLAAGIVEDLDLNTRIWTKE